MIDMLRDYDLLEPSYCKLSLTNQCMNEKDLLDQNTIANLSRLIDYPTSIIIVTCDTGKKYIDGTKCT